MKDQLTYNGYDAKLEYDSEDDSFYGIVINIPDTIHFQGRSIEELREEFRNSVEGYLEHCKNIAREPNKPQPGMSEPRTDTHKYQ